MKYAGTEIIKIVESFKKQFRLKNEMLSAKSLRFV